jgi:hypothetical protein
MTQEAITAYKDSGNRFVTLAKSSDDSAMAKVPAEHEWSGAFIVHHMADFEIHFAHRILRLLTEENPEIAGYSEEPYPTNLNYGARNWRASLELIEATRKTIGDVLSSIDTSLLSRPGVHSERGAITVADIVSSAAKHISAHSEQLEAALNS